MEYVTSSVYSKLVEKAKQETNEAHSLHIPSERRLKSRSCFLHSVKPAKVIRCNEWLRRTSKTLHRTTVNLNKNLARGHSDTAYKRWSCHSSHKLLGKLCRTFPPPAMGARFTVFWGQAGHANPLDSWRCFLQKRVMSRLIQVRQHHTN